MVKEYIPDRGDVLFVNFNPQRGHEQAGKRPALVLSPKQYNAKLSLAVVCPITSTTKGFRFDVLLHSMKKIHGVVKSDQVRSIDWRERKIKFVEKIPHELLNEVTIKLSSLILSTTPPTFPPDDVG